MNKEEYKEKRKSIWRSIRELPLIKNHAYSVELFNNGNNASIDIYVKHNNKSYYNKFMTTLATGENKNFIQYISFTKSDGSSSSSINISFKEEDEICK